MFQLDQRPCTLGIYLNTPTQKHGEERLPAKVIGIKGVMLSKDELNALFDDKHAWDMLYVEHKGKPVEPFWHAKLGTLTHAVSKFKGSQVSIAFGLKPYEVNFAETTVKSLKLEPTTGGLTALSFTIVCLKSNVTGDVARLDEHLNGSASVSLELGDPGDDEDDDEDQDELDLDHSQVADTDARPAKSGTAKTRKARPAVGVTVN